MPRPSLFLSFALATTAPAQQCQDGYFVDSAPGQLDLFGATLDVSGSRLAIGSPSDPDFGGAPGTVHVYLRESGGWAPEAVVTPADSASYDLFGRAVAMEGDTLVIGAPGAAPNGFDSGAVHVFERGAGGWTETVKLTPSGAAANDRFGGAVAISGDRLAVGAPGRDAGTSGGSVFVFARIAGTWQEEAQLAAADPGSPRAFGAALALEGSRLLVGAPQHPWNGTFTGSAYVLERVGSSWMPTAQLFASDGEAIDVFGNAVALSGDLAVIGAPNDDDVGTNDGACYVYELGASWAESAKLTAASGPTAGFLGSSVAIDGEVLLAGAPHGDVGGLNAGETLVFRRQADTWTEVERLVSLPSESGAWSGAAVALDGTTAAVGAPFATVDGKADAGAASVFELFCEIGAAYCDPAVANSTGDPGQLWVTGSRFVSDADVRLQAFRLPPAQFGYLLAAAQQAFVPNPGGSQGVLCLGGTIGRFTDAAQSSGPLGVIEVEVIPHDMPPPLGAILPGDTWNFQLWYRDKNPQSTSNFTNGVSVDFL